MCVKFTDAEIAYIKESVENYSSEFDIYDDEQELKLKIYEQIMLKIKSEYKDTIYSVLLIDLVYSLNIFPFSCFPLSYRRRCYRMHLILMRSLIINLIIFSCFIPLYLQFVLINL